MTAVEAICSRCKGEGHRAASCPNLPFFRSSKSCKYCKTVGHTAAVCPLLRQCAYCKLEGHTKLNCPTRPVRRSQVPSGLSKPKGDDSKSETASNGQSDVSTASTAAPVPKKQQQHWKWSTQWSTESSKTWKPRVPALTEDEERKARKMEKKLREIAALEDRLVAGENLDVLQQKKVESKAEFEDCEIMRKLHEGYRRCELPAKSTKSLDVAK